MFFVIQISFEGAPCTFISGGGDISLPCYIRHLDDYKPHGRGKDRVQRCPLVDERCVRRT